tara:strand:+ start:3855 stop:4241 length:387 start_codon:yes stop_codon:yes gene_type:complete
MHYKKHIKKPLYHHSIPKLKTIKECTNNTGIVYTLYDNCSDKLIIGHSFEQTLNQSNYINMSFKIIGKRIGRKAELALVRETLMQLGYKSRAQNYCYEYSERLLNHLKRLGWPTEIKYEKKLMKKFIH